MKAFDHIVEIGGLTYTLRYNFAVRRAFEKKSGKSVPKLMTDLATPETHTGDNLLAAWMMLLSSCHPDLSEDDVAAMIDAMGEDRAVSELSTALDGSTAHP